MRLNPCARAAGVSADTLRHYLREGLVEAAGRADNGYRTFDDRTVARVRFIRSAVGLGFTLADVAELLRMSAHGDLPCPRARQLLGERVTQQREHLDAMTALYRRMRGALREWRDMPDGVPDGYQVCGLIEGIAIPVPAHPARRHAARRR